MARSLSTPRIRNTPAATSRFNTARAWSSSARCRSSRCNSGGRRQVRRIANELTRVQRVSFFMPGPGGADDGRKIRMRGLEIQGRARGGRVGNQVGRVAGAPWLDHMRHLASGLGLDRAKDLAHGKSLAGAEIEGAARMSLQ